MRGASRQSRDVAAVGVLAALSAAPHVARADEPVAAREVRLLRETGENTTVIDAFDEDDPFDANLLLTFRQTWKSANIRRETPLPQGGLSSGGFVSATDDVASYSQSVSTLEIGTDIGLYRDLALSLRLPIILSDARELEDLDGSTRTQDRLREPSGAPLFSVPFKSPTRRGVDWFSVGLSYAILNQQRDDTKPTWVIGLESRVAIGPRLHACNADAPVRCPDPANPTGPSRGAGISRGMTMIAAQTVFSRRFGYVEPYLGFRMHVEVPQGSSDYAATSGLRGSLHDRPPVVGSFTVGTEVFPWEDRARFRRVGLDFKVRGTYHSPGRDYSELFDALGSSQAPSLRAPNPGAYRAGPDGIGSVADPAAAKVYFTGVTDQQAYGSFGASLGATWQTGEHVKLHAGLGLTYAQSHLVTASDACNPASRVDGGASGPCRSGGTSSGGGAIGIPNPNHRPVIDLPGRRFSVDDTLLVDLWLSGSVMF